MLAKWESILGRPLPDVLAVLEDPSASAQAPRQVTPFAGVLNAAERATVFAGLAATELQR